MNTIPSPSLFMRESGKLASPAILFLHGSPLSGLMWQPQLDALSSDFHCLAPDLPGHGQSASLGFVPVTELADMLAKLIRTKAAGGRAHIFGLSYGGVVAQALIARHPGLVQRALLSGTASLLSPFMQSVFRAYIRLNQPFLRLLPASTLARLLTLQFGIPRGWSDLLGEDMKRMDASLMARVLLDTYLAIPAPAETAVPLLVTVGGRETPFARGQACKLAHAIPGAHGLLLPGLNHVWNLQDPALFNRLARAWFSNGVVPEGIGRPL